MSIADLTWSGDIWLDSIQQILAKRLDRAARHVHNTIKVKLSLTGVGFGTGATSARTGIHYRRKQRVYGFVRSKPGEPPRKQTGTLRRHVAYETDPNKLVARVGVGGPPVATGHAYAIYLEFGTSKMRPRPYLRTTMWEQAGNITAILEGRGPEAVSGISTFGVDEAVGAGINLAAAVANVGKVSVVGGP